MRCLCEWVGGLNLHEPAADLAVCAAVVSAIENRVEERGVVYIGEVGLGGEIRSVSFLERRLVEARRLGMTRAVVPARSADDKLPLSVNGLSTVEELKSTS